MCSKKDIIASQHLWDILSLKLETKPLGSGNTPASFALVVVGGRIAKRIGDGKCPSECDRHTVKK